MESLLNEIQLSEKIHVSLACLRRWRLRGEGPQYVKVGPLVRYRPEVVEQWVDTRFGCRRIFCPSVISPTKSLFRLSNRRWEQPTSMKR
jgi:hypothetical protein